MAGLAPVVALPNELLWQVVVFLPVRSLASFSCTCKASQSHGCQFPSQWQLLLERDFLRDFVRAPLATAPRCPPGYQDADAEPAARRAYQVLSQRRRTVLQRRSAEVLAEAAQRWQTARQLYKQSFPCIHVLKDETLDRLTGCDLRSLDLVTCGLWWAQLAALSGLLWVTCAPHRPLHSWCLWLGSVVAGDWPIFLGALLLIVVTAWVERRGALAQSELVPRVAWIPASCFLLAVCVCSRTTSILLAVPNFLVRVLALRFIVYWLSLAASVVFSGCYLWSLTRFGMVGINARRDCRVPAAISLAIFTLVWATRRWIPPGDARLVMLAVWLMAWLVNLACCGGVVFGVVRAVLSRARRFQDVLAAVGLSVMAGMSEALLWWLFDGGVICRGMLATVIGLLRRLSLVVMHFADFASIVCLSGFAAWYRHTTLQWLRGRRLLQSHARGELDRLPTNLNVGAYAGRGVLTKIGFVLGLVLAATHFVVDWAQAPRDALWRWLVLADQSVS